MFLLDVNMLIALAWDDHVGHQAAHRWFVDNTQAGFATCHVTQSGFLRVSLQLYGASRRLTPQVAVQMLGSLTANGSHMFWEDGPVESTSDVWSVVRTHRQITDTNLFLIARRNQGKLATFDGGIQSSLPRLQREWIEIVPN